MGCGWARTLAAAMLNAIPAAETTAILHFLFIGFPDSLWNENGAVSRPALLMSR
jgi:hypothetical protein